MKAEKFTLEDVKNHFREAHLPRTVNAWNFLREEAKKKFSGSLIGQLDASGYITEWLKEEAK